MKNKCYKKSIIFIITVLFIGVNIVSGISIKESKDGRRIDVDISSGENLSISSFTFYTFDKSGKKQCIADLSLEDANAIYDLFEELKVNIETVPYGGATQALKNNFINLLNEYGLISGGISEADVHELLNPSGDSLKEDRNRVGKIGDLFLNLFSNIEPRGTGRALFCSVGSGGSGFMFPITMLLPRPRVFVVWSAGEESVTSVSELLGKEGFIAYGKQSGVAVGFTGVGLTYSVAGVTFYGFIGNALFASVIAESFKYFPENFPPTASAVSPLDGAVDVSLSTSEIRFRIEDPNGDLMRYSVTTDPFVGEGSGIAKPDGTYSIQISGLEELTEYTWTIDLTDGVNDVQKSFKFTTELDIPIIYDPQPPDDARNVDTTLSQLSFSIMDNQGDLMDYTVETSPDIGSDSATNVPDGIYFVDISGLNIETEYKWYVNVTDGKYWLRKIFSFMSELRMVFDPFDEGWQYRKKITINHTKVADDLIDFPVIISVVDSDLRNKAQDDGRDILFMDNSVVVSRLFHEIEYYDFSSGELIAWVKVTSLSSSEDTVLYMYYGNSNCIDQQYPAGTWDSGYDAVWHMDYEDCIRDSTSNNNDATRYGSITTKSGFIGKCQESYYNADGSNYIESDNAFFNQDDTSFTWNYWIYVKNSNYYYGTLGTKDWHDIIGDGQNNYKGYSQVNSGKIYWFLDSGDGSATYMYTNNSVVGSWAFITYKRYGNSVKLYHNGIEQGEGYTTWTKSSYTEMRLLVYRGGVYPGKWQRSLDGMMDEVQFSNIARSDAWLLTTFNSQGDPSSFFNVGPEESAP